MIPDGVIVSGLISKIINDFVDITKDKIRKADSDRKAKNQSFETRIYQVMLDAINQFTYDKYKNQDVLYYTAENILSGFKNGESNIIVVKSGLSNVVSNVDESGYEKFIRVLCHEISKEVNFDVYKEILLILLNQKGDCNYDELQQIEKKLDEVILKLDNQMAYNEKKSVTEDNIFENKTKQDYIKNWNSRLFLHQDNDERPLTLADAFIMPDYDFYYYNGKIESSKDSTFEQRIEKFSNEKDTSIMLITGVPGIGKTTITSWIANKYKEDTNVIILRFRDWEYDELKEGLLKAICNMLKCKRKDLNDKVLVLDGFDEIKCLDKREHILKAFINDKNDLEGTKIIITSRPTYIDRTDFNNIIDIKPFNITKVKEFYKSIVGLELSEKDVNIDNLDILGVPVILYMALMSNIDITQNTTKPELYNRIFAEKGGIFDKFCGYDRGSHIMRNSDNIKCYLEFLDKVAFKMFEKNSLVLSKDEYDIPKLSFQEKVVSVLEFPIKHLFENTSKNIEFIHKSIYEYFVAEYFYQLMYKEICSTKTSQQLANIFGIWMSEDRDIPSEIYDFLKYRVTHKLKSKYNVIHQTFQVMLQDGLSFYANKHHKKVFDIERRMFINMLKFVHLWENCYLEYNNSIYMYLNICKGFDLNLSGIILRGADLKGMDLGKIDLRGADLRGSDMRETELIGANLTEANLSDTDFRRADLSEANLDNAILTRANLKYVDLFGVSFIRADLSEANLGNASLYGADLNEAVLNHSIWFESNIKEVICKLKSAIFSYIIIEQENGERRKVYRNELFPDEN